MKKIILFLPLLLFAAHVFVLHRIDDIRYPSTSTSSKKLESYIIYLKKHGYKFFTVSEITQHLNDSKAVAFSIDDSYKSFYQNGLKVFKKYKIPFTLFVYVKATNQKWGDFVGWKELKKIQKYGELGIHSYAHPHLCKLNNKEIINDTKKAINIFKKHMGYVPKLYAYPYGEYDDRVKKIINSFFKIIVNQNPGALDSTTKINDIDRFALVGKSNFLQKLKTKKLHAKIDVIQKNGEITEIKGEVFDKIPFINLYITGFGVKKINLKNNHFSFKPHFKLKKYRNRVIISYNNKIISKMIIKGGQNARSF
jgi:peptidoglycan/xylan/chitin deacetylase (PgdA/CDA1 family)